MSKKLSVIIANRNDTAMLSITVNSCIEALIPLGLSNCEIIICDNSDKEIYPLLNSVLPTGYFKEKIIKVFRQDFPCLFTARETAASHAQSDYIACLDSHMLVGYNTFLDLYNFMESHKDDKTLGFAHAPINWAHHHARNARHDRDMSVNELGDWNNAYDYERTITWKGMPWICRKNWFLNNKSGLGAYGTLSKYAISWGGGDMHIGIKPWLLGYKNWAVPTRPCVHIGPFPKIDTGQNPNVSYYSDSGDKYRYRTYIKSGNFPSTFGFLVSCYVLGGEPMMERNKAIITDRFGSYLDVQKWWAKAIQLGQEERDWLLSRQVISFEELLKTQPWDYAN